MNAACSRVGLSCMFPVDQLRTPDSGRGGEGRGGGAGQAARRPVTVVPITWRLAPENARAVEAM